MDEEIDEDSDEDDLAMNDEFDDDALVQSDDSDEKGAGSSDDSDVDEYNEDGEKLTKIEIQSRKLDAQKKLDEEMEEEEMKTNIEGEQFELPEEGADEEPTTDISQIMQRIREIIHVLSDFKKFRQEGRSRQEYVNLLIKDLANYYGYSVEFMKKLVDLFPEGRDSRLSGSL